MPCCVIPNCRSRRGKKKCEAENYISLFTPRTDDMLLTWQQAIDRAGIYITLHKCSHVCELHFRQDEVEKFFITNLPNGNTFKLLKERATLKKGAVPSILTKQHIVPILPEDTLLPLSSNILPEDEQHNYCQSVAEDSSINEDNNNNNNNNICDVNFVYYFPSVQSPLVHRNSIEDFLMIRDKVDAVQLPTQQWFSEVFHDKVLWTNWNDPYNTTVRVTLLKDMMIRVFIEDKEVHVTGLKEISGIEKMSDVLRKVSTLLPCPGVGIDGEKAEHCIRYVLRKTDGLPGRPGRRCAECNKTRCLVIRRKRDTAKNEYNDGKKTRNMRNKVKNWLKKDIRLRRKIMGLKQRITSLRSRCAAADANAVEAAISKFEVQNQLDTILDKGNNMDVLPEAVSILQEHDYCSCSTTEFVLAYVGISLEKQQDSQNFRLMAQYIQ